MCKNGKRNTNKIGQFKHTYQEILNVYGKSFDLDPPVATQLRCSVIGLAEGLTLE